MYTAQIDHTLTRSETRRKTNLAKHYTARVFEKMVVGLMQGFVKPSASHYHISKFGGDWIETNKVLKNG